jgi:hypothetical protein
MFAALKTSAFAVVCSFALGCGGDSTDEVATDESDLTLHAIDIGMNEWPSEFPAFEEFRRASGSSEARLCHVYTYWNIAHEDSPTHDATHKRAGLIQLMHDAAAHCDEVLVTFQGKQATPEAAPHETDFEHAFVAFQRMTDPGQPLASWRGKLSYTPWNEPNNQNPSGSGLTGPISPELAARYYLAIRKHCHPSNGCKVAAGDFATNGGTARDIELNCADDADPANSPTHCAHRSSVNPGNAPPSYLDRYKNFIARHATEFGLRPGLRPEYFAYHPWHEVNAYIESHEPCSTYADCTTRRLLHSLAGSWSGAEIWDTEIGVGLQTNPAPNESVQACGAAFLVALTKLSPRIKRIYYMQFAGGNGPLFDGTALRPAGTVLAHRQTTYRGARCPATGM